MRQKNDITAFLFILTMLVFIFSGCAALHRDSGVESAAAADTETGLQMESGGIMEDTDAPQTDDPKRETAETSSDTDESTAPPEKVYCTATLDDEFIDNDVCIVVQPAYNRYPYDISDFADINCIGLEELWPTTNADTPNRIINLVIEGHSKENVLAAIKTLEARDDIYSAEPNMIHHVID